jgi:outer membrane receptor protein involved in Fe transport
VPRLDYCSPPPLRRASLVAAALSIFAATAVRAQEKAEPVRNIEELDLEQLLGTVTSASRTEESVLTAPATVTVLDQNDIIQSGATTIPDLLRKVPGVQVLEMAPGDYLVSLRGTSGLTGNNVVVLLDGTPLNSRIDGNVDWSVLPIDVTQVQRIEVVRGPVSTIYGPDAYTGVISIISMSPSESRAAASMHLAAGIDSSGKPAGIVAGTVSGTHGTLSARLSMNGRYDSTFSGAGSTPAWATGGGTAFLQYDPSAAATLTLEVGGAFSRRSALDHLVLESLPQDNTLLFANFRLLIHKLPSIFESLEIWERIRSLEIRARGTFAGFSYGGANSFDEETGFDLRFALPRHFKLAVGALGGVEYVDAPFIHPSENAKLRPRYGFYVDAGFDWHKLSLSAAARADASELANGIHFAGRGSVIWHEAKWALRLTAGGAYRDPTYVEVAGRFVDPETRLILLEGTPGLNPPQITAIELGAIIAPWGKLTIKPTVYVAQLTNLMVENFEPLVRKTFVNETGQRWLLGGELEASLEVRKELFIEANVVGLFWLTNPSGPSPTIATPGQNSTLTAWVGARSNLVDGRVALSLGLGYTSSRDYNLRAGIPPLLLATHVPDRARIEAAANYKLSARLPLWVSLKVLTHVLHDEVESPFPGSSKLGTSIFVALDYR